MYVSRFFLHEYQSPLPSRSGMAENIFYIVVKKRSAKNKHLFVVNITYWYRCWLVTSIWQQSEPIMIVFRSSSVIKSKNITITLKHVFKRLISQSHSLWSTLCLSFQSGYQGMLVKRDGLLTLLRFFYQYRRVLKLYNNLPLNITSVRGDVWYIESISR